MNERICDDSGVSMNLLDDMTKMIIDDCKKIGIKDYQIENCLKNQFCQNPIKGGDYMLFAYNLNRNDSCKR